MTVDVKRSVLPLIVIAQFLGTASWFAGNAVLPKLIIDWSLTSASLVWITNSVQLGFIVGALVFALFSAADRFHPSRLFFACTSLSSLINLITALWVDTLPSLLILRFLSGFLLAGIYPVGMKIAASWFPHGLGRALGYLIGALALGTGISHFFAFISINEWQNVFYLTSLINLVAGILIIVFVGDGPGVAKPSRVDLSQIRRLVHIPKLRCSAGGYFGHMWELYAVWAIAPLWIESWVEQHDSALNISLISFLIIASGGLGCVLGGIWSQSHGSAAIASRMLITSGLCCLLSPVFFQLSLPWIGLFWFIWGFSVVADSPQFSALSAQYSPADAMGSSLTLINAIGFTMTLISIQLIVGLIQWIPVHWAVWILLPGPVLGVIAMRPLQRYQPK